MMPSMSFETRLSSSVRCQYEFYQSGDFTDVTIHISGEIFRAHRLVLAANSDYFASALSTRFDNSDVQHLKDFDPRFIRILLPTFCVE